MFRTCRAPSVAGMNTSSETRLLPPSHLSLRLARCASAIVISAVLVGATPAGARMAESAVGKTDVHLTQQQPAPIDLAADARTSTTLPDTSTDSGVARNPAQGVAPVTASTSSAPARGSTASPTPDQPSNDAPAANVAQEAAFLARAPGLAPAISSMDQAADYRLKVDLDYPAGTVTLDEIISFTNRAHGTVTQIDLYFMPRATGEVKVVPVIKSAGAELTYAWTNNANMLVTLPQPLDVGQAIELQLHTVLAPSANLSSSQDARVSKANGIMALGYWYPVLSDGHGQRNPGDAYVSPVAHSITLDLTHTAGLVVAAPGTLAAGSDATHKVYTLRNARDFTFAVSPRFIHRGGHTASGVAIDAYARSAVAAASALTLSRRAFDVYDAKLGSFEWDRLVVIQSPRAATGNEFSSVISLGEPNMSDPLVVEHETAHQWFYAMVGDNQFNEPWLDESFAEFVSRAFFASAHGYCSSRPVNSQVDEFPNRPATVDDAVCGSYDQTVYFKGQALLFGLKSRMGSTDFWAAMRDIVATYRGKMATTEGIRSIFLAHGAPAAYFDSFIRR
jgi:hypothetical protein